MNGNTIVSEKAKLCGSFYKLRLCSSLVEIGPTPVVEGPLELFSDNVLKHLLIQPQISYKLL